MYFMKDRNNTYGPNEMVMKRYELHNNVALILDASVCFFTCNMQIKASAASKMKYTYFFILLFVVFNPQLICKEITSVMWQPVMRAFNCFLLAFPLTFHRWESFK